MAFELKHYMPEAHVRNITCISYNPFRREIYSGSEDGKVRIWDGENAKLVTTMSEHAGWVSALLFCKDLKVIFSSSVDGNVVAWSTSGKMLQKVCVGEPVYSLAYNPRRLQLIVGGDGKVRVYQLISPDDVLSTSDVIEPACSLSTEHSDIVTCITSYEGRFYTSGYDRRIVIYDSPHVGEMALRPIHVIQNAHDAAISVMAFGKDTDNQWLISGSFDRCVKLWSLDGNLLQRFDNFPDTITALCYVSSTQSLWVSANSHVPLIYDLRGGVNISDFVSTDAERLNSHDSHFGLKGLIYVPELREVVGFTNRRSVILWRYNQNVELTTLSGHSEAVESVSFTANEPLLIFSAGGDGVIRRWERLQLNAYMYSQEVLRLPSKTESRVQRLIDPEDNKYLRNPVARRKAQSALHRKINEKIERWRHSIEEQLPVGAAASRNAAQTFSEPALQVFNRKQRVLEVNVQRQASLEQSLGPGGAGRRNRGGVPRKSLLGGKRDEDTADSTEGDPSDRPGSGEGGRLNPAGRARGKGLLKVVCYDALDCVVAAGEDASIRVWMYADDDIDAGAPAPAVSGSDEASATRANVSNRVAGLSCKYVFSDHQDSVTCLQCVPFRRGHFLLSSGWDQRIFLWDLTTGVQRDTLRSVASANNPSRPEVAADGIVLDMDYAPSRNEYAYASADGCAYVRRFALEGDKMSLVMVLQGHSSEVSAVKWHPDVASWITGGDDGTFRVWAADEPVCLRIVQNGTSLTTMALDSANGCILTGSSDRCLQVYDPQKNYELVQTNVGHQDEIRSIVHLPSRGQYATASVDKTLKIWNAYMRPGQRRPGQHGSLSAAEADSALPVDGAAASNLRLSARPATSGSARGANADSLATNDPSSLQQARLQADLASTIGLVQSALAGTQLKAKSNAASKHSSNPLSAGLGMGLDSV